MIQNLLKNYGLNETEQNVFLFLLEYSPTLASTIAKKTNIKRPTVYAVLENLIKFGIVIKQKQNNLNYFAPVPLKMIPKVLMNKFENDFELKKNSINLLVSQLENYKKTQNISHFENVTFETIEAVYSNLEESLLSGDFCGFFNPQILAGKFKNLVEMFLKKTAVTKPHIKEILVAGKAADWYKSLIKNKNHLIKEVPKNSLFPSDFIFINGEVLLLDYNLKNEMAIRISHKNYYTSMVTLFNMLWKKL